MENIIIVLILAAVVGGTALYLYKAKRRGQRCFGCPYCAKCGGNCSEQK